MKKLKSVIIGCGAIFPIHTDGIIKNNTAEITAVCDIDENLAKEKAKELNCNYYTDYQKMIDDMHPDVTHICTPHYLHAPMTIYALSKGVNVLLEKPCGMNMQETEQMLSVEERSGKKVCVCLQNRYNNTTVEMKKIIDSGELGEITGIRAFVTWNRGNEYYSNSPWRGKKSTEGSGLLMNQTIHTLDLMQYFGGAIESVFGSVSTKINAGDIEVEDTADALIIYKNGARGIFFGTNGNMSNKPVQIDVELTKGNLIINNNELVMTKENQTSVVISDDKTEGGKSYWGVSHYRVIERFYDYLNTGRDTGYVSLKEGAVSLKVCRMILESHNLGQKIMY